MAALCWFQERTLTSQLEVGRTGSYLCAKGGPLAPTDGDHVVAVISLLISKPPLQGCTLTRVSSWKRRSHASPTSLQVHPFVEAVK
jgi:hypothetical protein